MKNKKSRVCVVTAVLSAFLLTTGCGGAGSSVSENVEDKIASMTDSEIESAINSGAEKLDESVISDGGAAESSKSDAEQPYKHYEADPGWSGLTIADRAIQIDDVLYVPGMPASDFMELVESSEVEYTYEYNKDRLVSSKKFEKITIQRNGEDWIRASAVNPYGETKSLSELPVIYIEPAKNAREYTYQLDGRSYNSILEMTYNDVKALGETIFSGAKFSEENETNSIRLNYNFSIWDKEVMKTENTEWTGFRLYVSHSYSFYVSKDTSKVTQFFAVGASVHTESIEE